MVKLAIEKGSCNKYAVKIITKKTFSVGVRSSWVLVRGCGMQLDQVVPVAMVHSGRQAC